MSGEEAGGVLTDHLPVADGNEVGAFPQPVNREMIDDPGDVLRAARVLHVEEDGAAPGGEGTFRLRRHGPRGELPLGLRHDDLGLQ